MAYSVSTVSGAPPRLRSSWFLLAAVTGGLHTVLTLYWAVGGHALLWTMGASFIAKFASMMWVLYPLALVKAVGAFGPLCCQRWGWPLPRLTRLVSWVAAVVLIAWGGMNTVVGNIVLWGLIHPADGYDRDTMIGHAWMWDPLFVVWGVGLLVGLIRTRTPGRTEQPA